MDPSPAATDPGLRIYIADRDGHQVLRYDGDRGTVRQLIPEGRGGLREPSDVALGPDGALYVADFASGEILRYDAESGAFLGLFFADGRRIEEPVQIFFRHGRLYTLGNDTMNVVLLDADTGAPLADFGYRTMRFPHGFAFGPDGLLYVAMEWNQTLGLVQIWDTEDLRLVDFLVPRNVESLLSGIAFGPDGQIYLSDWWGERVLRYDRASRELLDEFIPAGEAVGPSELRFGPDGDLYLLSEKSLVRHDGKTGALEAVLVAPGEAGMVSPRGFCIVDRR